MILEPFSPGWTYTTETWSGVMGVAPLGSVPSEVSRMRRRMRRIRCSEWVSMRKVFFCSPRADSMNISPNSRCQAGVQVVFRLLDEDGFDFGSDALDDHRQDLAEAEADVGETDVDAGVFIEEAHCIDIVNINIRV